MEYYVLPNTLDEFISILNGHNYPYYIYGLNLSDVRKTYTEYTTYFTTLSLDVHKEYFAKFRKLRAVVKYNDISEIDIGSFVGVFENDELQKVFVMPDNENNKYVRFRRFTISNVNGMQVYLSDEYNHYSNNNEYMMRYDDFKSMINDFVKDGIIVDMSNVSLFVYKSNIVKKSGLKIYDTYDDYYWSNGCIKCSDIVIDDKLKKHFQDNFARYKLEVHLNTAKELLQNFLTSQTSFDNVSRYTTLLDAIEKS